MPKWKSNADEFSVTVSYNEWKGMKINEPIPILEKLGKPDRIKFIVGKKGVIHVEAGGSR